jgi:hypothetical protein
MIDDVVNKAADRLDELEAEVKAWETWTKAGSHQVAGVREGLVRRLRAETYGCSYMIRHEAAAEIERLRALVETLPVVDNERSER